MQGTIWKYPRFVMSGALAGLKGNLKNREDCLNAKKLARSLRPG